MIYRSMRVLGRKAREHRTKCRGVYKSKDGQDELFNWLHDLGCFRTIEPSEVDARNRAIRKMEELGLLDEMNIRYLIECFFSLDLDAIEAIRAEKQQRAIPKETEIDLYETD